MLESFLSDIDGHFSETFWPFYVIVFFNAAFRQQLKLNKELEKTTVKSITIEQPIHKNGILKP